MTARIRAHYGLAPLLAVLCCGWTPASQAGQITYLVTVLNTSGLGGATGTLDFQFNPLGAGGLDTALISTFNPGGGSVGAVNTPPTTGDVSGSLSSLPLTLTDDQPLSELNQTFTYGASIQYELTLTTFSGTPGASFFFSMFDQNGNAVDAGSNGVSAAEIDVDPGTGRLEPPLTGPGVTVVPLQASVPEPASLLLFALSSVGLAAYAKWQLPPSDQAGSSPSPK
ncbi:MAG TPA: NF038129 family PEP-CTERM protein [Gemmataceae bacterium]|nr:NF038129 family PEP-CTERM protein [Gemmataceae bacterium]